MSTIDPKERVKADTHARLTKYGTPQLLTKLEAGTLIGLSKEVAIEILEKRKQDVSKYKGETWTKPKAKVATPQEDEEVPQGEMSSTPTPTVKAEAKKTTKVEKKPKVEKVRKSVVLIDETDKKVAKVLADENTTKTEKITSLLEMGYSVNQISKSSLKAHYSFCHTIANNLSAKSSDTDK